MAICSLLEPQILATNLDYPTRQGVVQFEYLLGETAAVSPDVQSFKVVVSNAATPAVSGLSPTASSQRTSGNG